MNRSLFGLSQDFYVLYDLLNDIRYDESTGEIINDESDLKDLFGQIEGELGDKLDSSIHIVRELEGKSSTLDKEIKRLQARKKAIDNNVTRLKGMMLNAIKTSGLDKIKTELNTFSIRKSKKPNILNEDLINRQYLRIKREVDRTSINKALKRLDEIKGVEEHKEEYEKLVKSLSGVDGWIENESIGVR